MCSSKNQKSILLLVPTIARDFFVLHRGRLRMYYRSNLYSSSTSPVSRGSLAVPKNVGRKLRQSLCSWRVAVHFAWVFLRGRKERGIGVFFAFMVVIAAEAIMQEATPTTAREACAVYQARGKCPQEALILPISRSSDSTVNEREVLRGAAGTVT